MPKLICSVGRSSSLGGRASLIHKKVLFATTKPACSLLSSKRDCKQVHSAKNTEFAEFTVSGHKSEEESALYFTVLIWLPWYVLF